MNREFLKGLELEDQTVESIMAEYGKSVNQTKDDLEKAQSELDSVKSERKTLKKQLQDRDTQLEDLRGKAQGHDDLQATIDELKQANASAKEQYEKQLHDQQFNYELERHLMSNKARNPKAVRALLDTDTIKLEDGEVKGLSEQLESLKESDGYLFETDDTSPEPTPTHVPGPSSKTNNPKSVDPVEAGKLKAMERHGNKEEK